MAHDPIPFDEIARFPLPGTAVPVQVAFGAGDVVLTYLHSPDGSLDRRLFAVPLGGSGLGEPVEVSLAGGTVSEEDLPLEERLRRERTREVGLGITTAEWAEEADVLLVPLPSGLHVVTGLAADATRPEVHVAVTSGGTAGGLDGEPIVDAHLSPDGTKVAFVRGGELFVAPALSGAGAPGEPIQLTSGATEGVTNGLAEFIAQEEMDRDRGFWWSRDGEWIAFAAVDERHIPVYRIVHQGSDEVGPGAEEDHRYPFAGAANAVVRLGVVAARGGDVVWMDTGDPDRYLARVHWMPDGGLVAELESRDQRMLEVVRLDAVNGSPTVLHQESSPTYLNLHDDFWALSGSGPSAPTGAWLWSSERTGFRHLELRSADGSLIRVLTDGPWLVDHVEGVDEERGIVYFTGTKDGPTEQHLYAVPLAGGEIRRLTGGGGGGGAGTHSVVIGRTGSGTVFVDRHSSLESPPRLDLRALADGSLIAPIFEERDPRIDELGLEPPELVRFPADDGTELYGLLYRPEVHAPDASAASAPAPLVVSVYGGPHVQQAVNGWGPTVALRAQALRRLGACVLIVDNRGSARRGHEFEAAIAGNAGDLEVTDQVAGVRWAVAQGLADPERVGVYGWSYGGYMSLMCLARAGDVFHAAVAGAPVTHWDGYDTHYTERYMGTPQENPEGYERSSVMAHVDGMSGDLLLVHGLIDENVHFRHTARLVNRLVRAGKPYRLLLFPDERHLPRSREDRAFMEAQVIGWLGERLGLSQPAEAARTT